MSAYTHVPPSDSPPPPYAPQHQPTNTTINKTNLNTQELDIDYKVPTAMATSLVNMTAIAWKDRNFARMMSKEPAVFPLASYGACVRACLARASRSSKSHAGQPRVDG